MDRNEIANELARRIEDVEQDMIDDANSAENSGERPDLWDYAVELDLGSAKSILAALREQPSEASPARDAVGRMVKALQPFADYADPRNQFPEDHRITAGSPFAKRQLTMGDCYEARAAIAALEDKTDAVP